VNIRRSCARTLWRRMKNAISSKKNNSNTPTIEPAITAVWFEDLLVAEDPSFEDVFEVKGGIKPVLVEGRTTVFVEVNPLPANLGTPELLFNGAGILFPGDTDVLLPRETGVLVGAGVEAPDDESELFTTALTRGFLELEVSEGDGLEDELNSVLELEY